MNNAKRWLLGTGGGVLGAGAILAAVGLLVLEYVIDLAWFDSLGYQPYFWQRMLYKYVAFAMVALLFFTIFLLNFWIASRFLGTAAMSESRSEGASGMRHIAGMVRSGSFWFYAPLSLILATVVAMPVFREWESFLLYLFSSDFGVTDPVYGKDISYYLFSYPIYSLLQRRLFLAFLILLLAIALLYWLEKRLLLQEDRPLHRGARRHLSFLVTTVFALEIWNFVLQRYELLYNTQHEPLFFGPGYAQMRVILPSIWVVILMIAATCAALVYFIQNRKGYKYVAASALLLVLALGSRYSTYLPGIVHKYYVEPNQISRELPYIENSIKSTLSAYNLNDVEMRSFKPEPMPPHLVGEELRDIFGNIPVYLLRTLHMPKFP